MYEGQGGSAQGGASLRTRYSDCVRWLKARYTSLAGAMWWCCGEASMDAPGCRSSKHQNKEDEEEVAAEQKDGT